MVELNERIHQRVQDMLLPPDDSDLGGLSPADPSVVAVNHD
jgi:hypothetical protein